MTEFTKVAVASRAFSLAAIIGMAFALQNAAAVGVAIVVIGIAAAASAVGFVSALPNHWVIAGEATLASLVVVTALPHSFLLLPYLVVLPLLMGLARGVSGASFVVVPQLSAILVVTASSVSLSDLRDRIELLSPWALTIVGAGLLGAWAKKIGKSPVSTGLDEKYDSARRLLGQLRNLARRMPSGLDPVTVASQMLARSEEHIGPGQSAVFSRTEGGLFAPIAYRGAGARETLSLEDELIALALSSASAASRLVGEVDPPTMRVTVLPLRLGSEMIGVLLSRVATDFPTASLESLQRELDDLSLRLATALAFDDVRNLVTADERQRLSREIHDGVAQEVASLGYVVDELAATSNDPSVSAGLVQLRGELSRIVTELRLSIFDLRTQVGEDVGLGSALSDYVRKVGAQSAMTVHLSLDEAPVRLSPGVETELFRIAQEAITNARKHSDAQNLWVDCWVRAPSAVVRVRDDGRGVKGGRSDSYGLLIMQERAERIGASVELGQSHGTHGRPGTCVTITVGAGALPAVDHVEVAS